MRRNLAHPSTHAEAFAETRRKQGRAADHDQEVAHTEQQIALARAAFERDQERIRAHQLGMEERDKGKRRAPYEGEAARKRRDSDASR